MAYKLTAPITKQLKLDKIDPTGETHVIFRQATRGDHDRRSDLSAEISRIFTDETGDRVEIKQRISMADLHATEVMLTLIGCNILDENDEPLFRFKTNSRGRQVLAMSETEFRLAWNKLDAEVADEIHEKCLEANVQWGRRGPEE